MRIREHDRNDKQRTNQTSQTPSPGGASAGTEEVRRRAQRLLDLADETIDQALSQNSERFLAQNRQRGGQ